MGSVMNIRAGGGEGSSSGRIVAQVQSSFVPRLAIAVKPTFGNGPDKEPACCEVQMLRGGMFLRKMLGHQTIINFRIETNQSLCSVCVWIQGLVAVVGGIGCILLQLTSTHCGDRAITLKELKLPVIQCYWRL